MATGETSDDVDQTQARIAALEEEIRSVRAALAVERKAEVAASARSNAILDVAIDGIVTIDEAGLIESANPAIQQIFGYAPEELVGASVNHLMTPPDLEAHDRYLQNYRETGKSTILGVGREVLARHQDGRVFPIELAVTEFSDGGRRLFMGMIRDVTRRREAEEEVRANHDRLRAILDSAVDGILAIDDDGSIRDVNPAVERIFGYEPEELVGKNVRVLMPEPFRGEHDGYLRRFLETGEPRIIGFGREVRGRRKDGSVFPLYLAVSEGYLEHQRVFTGIVRDLGTLRDVEARARQAEQLAALSTITAGIAHDVGTPMTTILGYAELLKASAPDEKNRQRAGLIVDQVRRVTDLLRTLLNIANPGRSTPQPLALVDVLDHSVEFFREKLKGRGIVVERDYEPVPTIVANRDRLEQVFLNLIVNAADAMPQGGTLTVRLSRKSNDFIEIGIEDTGVGMGPEMLDRIFEAFYTTKERGKGTGLGLLVSQQIIRDHGGNIAVESEPGQGTKFKILLPLPMQGSTNDG